MEKWSKIIGHDNYMISTNGRVKNIRTNRILKQYLDKTGYPTVGFTQTGKHFNFYVHRLVAVAFIPNPDSKPQVNHKNSDRSDCSLNNLEWCTASENSKHAYRSGRVKMPHSGACGNTNGAKATISQVLEIRAKALPWTGFTTQILASEFGLSKTSIKEIKRRKTFSRV